MTNYFGSHNVSINRTPLFIVNIVTQRYMSLTNVKRPFWFTACHVCFWNHSLEKYEISWAQDVTALRLRTPVPTAKQFINLTHFLLYILTLNVQCLWNYRSSFKSISSLYIHGTDAERGYSTQKLW